jgi:integrase
MMAMRWGLVVRNVASLVALPPVRRAEIQPLSPDEIVGFYHAVKDHSLGPLFLAALATGLRQGELLGLKWDDVDLGRGWLTVRQQLQRIGRAYVALPPKSERSRRRIALGTVALGALTRQREQQSEWQVQMGSAWEDMGLVFTTTTGRPLNGPSITHRLAKLLTEKGVRVVRFHDLRHSAASLLLSEGASLKDVMDTLGHSQLSLVAQTYGHLYDPARRDVAAKMDRALNGDALLTHNRDSDAHPALSPIR